MDFWKNLNRLLQKKGFTNRVPTGRPFSQTGPGLYSSVLGRSPIALSIYEQNLEANVNRITRLRDYDQMDTTPMVSAALNIYADDSASYNEDGTILKITSSNERISRELERLFFEKLNIEFNAYHWVRTLCKYGDKFELLAIEPKKGIQGSISLPTAEIEREEAYDGDPNSVRFRWVQQVGEGYQDYQVAHFRLMGDDNYLPYGRSILESGRRAWKQLQLLEDAMLIYRVSRASEKRAWYIETGNLPPADVPNYLEQQRSKIKTEEIVNPQTGEIDLRYRSSSITEDFWLAKRGDVGSRVEVLQGGNRLNDIEDVEYIKQQLITSLGVPKMYLQFNEELSSKSSASKEDIRFARSVQRVQKIMISEFTKMAMIHLYSLQKYDMKDLLDFELSLYNPSTIMELGKLELVEKRLEIFEKAVETNAYSYNKAKSEILHFSDNDIKVDKQKILDGKKFIGKLQKIVSGEDEQQDLTQVQDAAIDTGFEDSTADEASDEVKDEFSSPDSLEQNNTIKQGDKKEFSIDDSELKFENNYQSINNKKRFYKSLPKLMVKDIL